MDITSTLYLIASTTTEIADTIFLFGYFFVILVVLGVLDFIRRVFFPKK